MNDDPGPLVASGRAADVYDLGNGRVVRRYRTNGTHDATHDVELEARVMRHVADAGYPVPTVHDADGRDLVMDRIDGPTMLEALDAAPWKLLWCARQLSALQRRLARIAAPEWMLADTADDAHAHSVLHLDLHPMNVILSPRRGPVVIDWTNAAGGPAGFDAAMSYVVIATFTTTSTRDRLGQQAFVEAFRRFRGPSRLDPYIVAACDHRLADRGTLPDERVAVAALRTRRLGRTSQA